MYIVLYRYSISIDHYRLILDTICNSIYFVFEATGRRVKSSNILEPSSTSFLRMVISACADAQRENEDESSNKVKLIPTPTSHSYAHCLV